jgi:hypothetical protein
MAVDPASAAHAVSGAVAGWSDEDKAHPDNIDNIALFAETAVSNAAAQAIPSSELTLDYWMLQNAAAEAEQARNAVTQVLLAEGIYASREIRTGITLYAADSQVISIAVDNPQQLPVERVRIENPYIAVSITKDTFAELAEDEPLFVSAEPINARIYGLIGDGLPVLTAAASDGPLFGVKANAPVIVHFPALTGNIAYQGVIDENGDSMICKDNTATNTLDTPISGDAVVMIKRDNRKNFWDTQNLSANMREAIDYLTSKGVVGGRSDTEYDPESDISRAEIATLIIRALGKNHLNQGNGGFDDVARSDWFYDYVGATKRHGIMTGFPDNTFKGTQIIDKTQIMVVISNTLVAEMAHTLPTDVEPPLTVFADRAAIPDWAARHVALAVRLNLVTRRTDGRFVPEALMSRGDAALTIQSMFKKIWY